MDEGADEISELLEQRMKKDGVQKCGMYYVTRSDLLRDLREDEQPEILPDDFQELVLLHSPSGGTFTSEFIIWLERTANEIAADWDNQS